jgi:ubiquinone/menaquinone biosynthesis C-methylase UbiE
MSDFGHGYVTDIPYTRGFIPQLAPEWLDFTAIISGTMPPRRGDAFSWCELGCGQGVTAVVLAATHPRARFVGIDLLPEHVDHARRLAAEAGVANASFHVADFAAAALDPPGFDYVVAHGVYSWVDAASQDALLRLIDRHLKPQGLSYLGYNAMPGWAADLPFQRLVRELGAGFSGNSAERFVAAVERVRALREAGAPSLKASPIASNLDGLLSHQPLAYLAHEYMNAYWQPLFVTEVRAAMARIGLVPAGAAILGDNFDSFVLRRAERETLAAIEDPDQRELARDVLMDQRFRRDVFSRDGAALDDDARRERLLKTRYALARPPEEAEYRASTGAGTLSFDNATARAIVDALADGPRIGNTLQADGADRQDVIANLMALCSAGIVRPVAPADGAVAALNQAICRRMGGSEAIEHMALSCGTAVRVEPAVLLALGRKGEIVEPAMANWLRYLARHAETAGMA